MTDISKTGGCLCGAVRYEVTADYIGMGQCHCRDCQIIAGGAAAHVAIAPAGSINVTGEVKPFYSDSKKGTRVVRKFCPTCGTHLFSQPGDDAPIEVIKVGSLDDSSGYAPSAVLWTSTAMPWHDIPENAMMTFEEDIDMGDG